MSSFERFAPASGWIGVALYALAALCGGLPPMPDAPADAVSRYLAEHRSLLIWQALLVALAIPLLVIFFSWLRGTLARVEGGDAPLSRAGFAGFLLLIATYLAGQVPLVALVWRGAESYPLGLVQFAYDASVFALYPLTATLSMLSILAPSVVAWRGGLLPSWLYAVIGALVAANLGELAGLRFATGFLAAGAGPGLVAPPAWALWVAGTSWHLWRRQLT
jgi:hypothetical protein